MTIIVFSYFQTHSECGRSEKRFERTGEGSKFINCYDDNITIMNYDNN